MFRNCICTCRHASALSLSSRKKSKKNSEPLITSAFTAENRKWFYHDSNQRPSDHEMLSYGRPIASLIAVCVH